MKKLLVFILTVLFILSGCSSVSETLYFGGVANIEFEYTGKTGREESILLYYLNPLGKLKAESRKIEVFDDGDLLYTAITEQLAPPKSDSLSSVNFGVKLEYAELSENLCSIYLTSDKKGDNLSKYTLGCALAGMVHELFSVEYTALFIDGKPVYTGEEICQPFTKTTEVLAEELKLKKRYNGEANVVLYFPSADGKYILPEVRTIYAKESKLLEAVLTQLKTGPSNSYTSPIFNAENAGTSHLSHKKGTVSLKFDKYPYVYTDMLTGSDSVYQAAIVYTFSGIVSANVDLNTASSNIESAQRHEYRSYLGARTALYLPNSTYSMLHKTMHTVPQYDARRTATKISGLLEGPLASDPADVYPALPAGISASDFISVATQDNMAIIDVSANFFDTLLDLSDDSEYISIFAIVNTLTEAEHIDTVLFTREGKPFLSRDYYLYFGFPFTKNPGINKK